MCELFITGIYVLLKADREEAHIKDAKECLQKALYNATQGEFCVTAVYVAVGSFLPAHVVPIRVLI